MKQKISVRAIIKIDNKVLLLRRAAGNPKYVGQWELPGGKVDFGEDPGASIYREVAEEIGVDVGPIQLYRVASWVDSEQSDTQHIVLVYLAALAEGKVRLSLSKEHDKFEWAKMSDLQLSEVNTLSKIALMAERDIQVPDDAESIDDQKVVEKTTNKNELIVYSDGGSRGNPGPSASGFVVFDAAGELLFEGGKYLGITTNNQAEYQAVKLGLEKALELGARVVDFRMDSQLVTNQLTGVYQIRNRDLWPIYANIKELVKKFDKVTFSHVRREFNKDADAMVNKILDQHAKA